MDGIKTGIDDITNETSALIHKLALEFQQINVKLTDAPSLVALWIAFHLGREYFLGAKDALNNKRLLTGTTSVRASLENVADILYIFQTDANIQKYAPRYVGSITAYEKALKDAVAAGAKSVFADRKLKQANSWTGATIDDRLKAILGTHGAFTTVYDMLSYFSHPNPVSINFIGKQWLREGQTNLVQQGNCMTAIVLMALVVNNSTLRSVSLTDLDKVGQRIGLVLIPPSTLGSKTNA